VKAEASGVKRIIYPPSFRLSTEYDAIVGPEYCIYAHVGFLAHGEVHISYQDGRTQEFASPPM